MRTENEKWQAIEDFFVAQLGKKPDLKGILFLIGVQELGRGTAHFSKEEKQDLMHIAVCKLLSYAGYYTLEGHDSEGWPLWQQTEQIPKFNLFEQERLLKLHIIHYFEEEIW
ncbi:MAG: hypothetical protein ACFCUI_09580 [Bernardetiaceae bacterium]